MAILTSVGTKVKKGLVKAADAGGNVVAKASGLTSDQLKNIEERREAYLSNRPEMDPERIVRCIGAYSIEVKNNNESLHKGPFKLRLKLKEDMKKYKKFYMIYVDDNNKEEDPIEFNRDGDYIEGSLPHLSDYILVGKTEEEVKEEEKQEEEQEQQTKEEKEEIHNPVTIDKISFYIITLLIVVISSIIVANRMKHKKYNETKI